MNDEIDISQFDKADVLAVLYNNARAQGMGFLHYNPEPMTKEQAQKILDSGQTRFDYLQGRVMKVDLKGNMLWPGLYDRDNGSGAAATAIASLTKKD